MLSLSLSKSYYILPPARENLRLGYFIFRECNYFSWQWVRRWAILQSPDDMPVTVVTIIKLGLRSGLIGFKIWLVCISSVVAFFVLSWFVDFSIILIWWFFSYIKLKSPFGKFWHCKLIILKWDVLFCPFMYVAHVVSKFYVFWFCLLSCTYDFFFLLFLVHVCNTPKVLDCFALILHNWKRVKKEWRKTNLASFQDYRERLVSMLLREQFPLCINHVLEDFVHTCSPLP